MTPVRRAALTSAALVLSLVAAGCGSGGSGDSGGPHSSGPDHTSTASTSSPAAPATNDDLDVAESEPVEDSYYPQVGDPGVDALHYALDLGWDPATDNLTGHEVLTFRATSSASQVRLALIPQLEVSSLTLDGEPVEHTREGTDLVVDAPVEADHRYELALDYAGTPTPQRAPTRRSDIPGLGFTIDDEHQVWTMQEPYGALTWYAVDDQPADKALYDFSLHVPTPWTGIANGVQTSSSDADGVRTTTYHLDEPAASYLVTLAFGDYTLTRADLGDLPIYLWVPTARPDLLGGASYLPAALRFLQKRLGPYPFSSAGILLVDSDSGMETQTLITLGDSDYSTSREVVVHEAAHQWYGDRVTPNDWRDVWMNEGMAMYLQWVWEAQQAGRPVREYMADYVGAEQQERRDAGPPAAYDGEDFGSANIYYGPAMMWQQIRERVGDRTFWALVRGWPESQDDRSTDRAALEAYWNEHAGTDLSDLFDAWLDSTTSPRFG